MTIKAIIRDGRIQPLEPLPAGWTDGQELVIEEPDMAATEEQIEQWEKELDAGVAQIPIEEHNRFREALSEIERASKTGQNPAARPRRT
ncbi:MAG: hypothetical protein ABSG31_01455 [Tepidisphaeraceae bacterium]|jgi:hypothetical protein